MANRYVDPKLFDPNIPRDELLEVIRKELIKRTKAVQPATEDTATGSSGVSTFIALTDTDPTTYVSQAGKFVRVNAGETGLELHTLDLTSRNQWSAIATYTPTWTAERYGVGPDVNYPVAAASNPAIGDGSINGFFKYNNDYLHCWGNVQFGSTTTTGLGRWVIGIPTSPAFSPPASARSVIGNFMARATNDDGSGQPFGTGTFIQGISVYGGPPDRLPGTIDDGGASEIDIQIQSTTGIRMATQAYNDFIGVLEGGGGVPVAWESNTDVWFYWDIMIPLR